MIDYDKVIGTEGLHAAEGAVVAPLLRLYLSRGDFPTGKKLDMPGMGHREPDGWFHPSSHPTMDERRLYHYLADPLRWQAEPFSFELRMSVTIGTLMHGIVQVILEDLGLWQMPKGTCPCCGKTYGRRKGQCSEPGVSDPVLKRRGHMDGVLMTKQLGMVGYDLKTMNHFSIAKMPDMDVEYVKVKHPYYYGQMQDYMAMSGLRMMIMVFMGMGLPWHIREVQVPYDEAYVIALEAKYRRVRAALEAGHPPDPCCSARSQTSRECPASTCYIKKI